MPIQRIEIGGYANDGTGDDLRTAFNKVNANFALLDSDAQINDGANVGTGTARNLEDIAKVIADKYDAKIEYMQHEKVVRGVINTTILSSKNISDTIKLI